MIDFENALKKAREYLPTINNYEEYDCAFVFGDNTQFSFGGSGQPVVIMKDTGDVFNYIYFRSEYPDRVLIAEGEI